MPSGGNDYKDALIATASIAAVVWTGGLIAIQIRNESSVSLINGLDLLQTAFLGSALALFSVGVPLRVVALIFGAFYLCQACYGWLYARRLRGSARPGQMATVPQGTFPVSVLADAEEQYSLLTLLSLLFYIPVIWWPSQKSVCIFGWSLTFLGMQMILMRLYAVDADVRSRAIPYAMAGLAAAALLYFMR